MITVERKSDIAYKSLKGVASTTTLRAYYEENKVSTPRVFPSQIWLQAGSIPSEAPGGNNEEVIGVVQRFVDLTLTQEPGRQNAWFSETLKDAIDPERFGVSYVFGLKDGLGNPIPPGAGDYEVNPDAGVVTFNDSYVPTSTPLTISFYKYVGTKGLGTPDAGGSGVVWVDDAADLRTVTDHDAGFTLQVFATSRVYKYVADSNLPDNGVDVIKPDDVTGDGRWVAWKVLPSVSSELELGAAPTGKDWNDGLIQVNEVSMQNQFNYEVSRILKLIAPLPPQGLAGRALSMVLYNASEAGTGDVHECTDSTSPVALLNEVLDPETGLLVFEADMSPDGQITLTSDDDSGTDAGLTIVSNYDPYSGEVGKEGFYKALNLSLASSVALSLGVHNYQVVHPAGNSLQKTFWVDNPTVAGITGVALTLPASISRFVSGVPSLSIGQEFEVDFSVSNAVRKHYNTSRLASITGSQVGTVNVDPPVVPPVEGSSPSYTGIAVALSGGFTENVELLITPYNSKGLEGTGSTQATGCRIDTISNEANRKRSGSGQFPASGYGAAYDSETSLKEAGYTEELQLLNGQYRTPSGNYSGALPVAGPDYSAGIGTGWRYAILQDSFVANNASGFTLTFTGTVGFVVGDFDTDNLRIQVKVEGVTGWLDANKSFALVGAPSADGDACMVYSESSANIRRVSFGNVPRSGPVWIRVGLPSTSTKRFTGLMVSNIV